jgi:arabinofuranosyltransferase
VLHQDQVVTSIKPKWLAVGAVVVLLGLIVRTAWVTEDAYITLRTVDNWVHGFGLRWNTDERVQGYTHPLWMFVLSAVYYVTREAFATALLAGILTTTAATLMLVKLSRSAGHAVAAVVLCILCRSFIEFSTSGLENPLTHLLIGLFVWQYAVREAGLRTLCLIAALLTLNRTDALLVALPALVHATFEDLFDRGVKRTAIDLAIGLSPLLAWELFSLFYYGFLVPNTAYAKLNTGLPRNELLRQGATYLINGLSWDPHAMIATAVGVAVAFMQARKREVFLAIGVIFYLAYVVWIGGDFMLGRFLTLPFFMAVCLLAIAPLPLEDPGRAMVVVLPFFILYWHHNATERYAAGDMGYNGIADERSFYRDTAGLMMFSRTRNLPAHQWVAVGREAKAKNEQGRVFDNVGFFGFYAGPTLHIIDQLALTEPLLARLPATFSASWRVGHYSRTLPVGFVDTTKSLTGECLMEDKNLCAYYQKLRLVIAGPLWSWERFKTIAGFQLGSYQYLIDRQRYRYPKLVRDTLTSVSAVVPEGAPWNAPGARVVTDDGIEIQIGRVSHAAKISLSVDGNDTYEVEFRKGTSSLDTVALPSLDIGFMHTRTFDVPKDVRSEGFDNITVRPVIGDGLYSVGYVRLLAK